MDESMSSSVDQDKNKEDKMEVENKNVEMDKVLNEVVVQESTEDTIEDVDATNNKIEEMVDESKNAGAGIPEESEKTPEMIITDKTTLQDSVSSPSVEQTVKENESQSAKSSVDDNREVEPIVAVPSDKGSTSVAPGVMDSDGFLAPPPASTLLIRRARVSSTGATTYVVTSGTKSSGAAAGAGVHPEDKGESKESAGGNDEPKTRRRPGRPVGSVCKYKKRKSESDAGEVRTSSRVPATGTGGADDWIYPTAYRVSHFSPGKPPMTGYHQPYSKDQKKNRVANIDPLTGKRRYTRRKKLGIEKKHHKEVVDRESPESSRAKHHLSDNGIWRPTDDFRLIVNVLSTGDLETVYNGVKFSCYFSYKDIEERWRKLMYGEKSSLVAQNAISALHPFVKARIEYESLFSPDEEKLIASVKNVPDSNPSSTTFQTLLDENPHIFNKHRTARQLLMHWLDMKDFHLLHHQSPKGYKPSQHMENYEDFMFDLDEDDDVDEKEDESIERETRAEDRRLKKKIRKLEDEIASWQLLTDQIIDDGMKDRTLPPLPTDFDNKTFALLRGKEVYYAMASREIVLGRSTKDNKVDANLTEEGSCSKISRKQAVIRLKDMGRFVIMNYGRIPIFVDKKAVLYRSSATLHDQSVIQIDDVNLVFFINETLIERIVEQDVRREVYASFKDLEKDMPPLPPSPVRPAVPRSPNLAGPSSSYFMSLSSRNPLSDQAHLNAPGRIYQYYQPPPVLGTDVRKDEPIRHYNAFGLEKRLLPISPLASCVNIPSSSGQTVSTVYNPTVFSQNVMSHSKDTAVISHSTTTSSSPFASYKP